MNTSMYATIILFVYADKNRVLIYAVFFEFSYG